MLPKWSWLWRHPLEHGQTSRGPTLKENQFSLSQQLSTVHISSDVMKPHARVPLHAGILSGLVFGRSCEMCHNHLWNVSQSLWVYRATALVCQESTVSPSRPCPLVLTGFLPSLLYWYPSLVVRRCDMNVSTKHEHSAAPTTASCGSWCQSPFAIRASSDEVWELHYSMYMAISY